MRDSRQQRLTAVSKVLNSDVGTHFPTPKLLILMDIRYHVGIDIAKATLDWAVHDGQKIVLQTSTANSVIGIKIARRLLKTLPDWTPAQAIFCMEHTATADRGYLQRAPA